jgi:hypothetical protein
VRRRWLWIAGVVCALAAASLALPSVPTTDAWGWIIWGRELGGGDLHTDINGSPSWKPLPVAFTFVLSVLGNSAPEGWLFVSRALGLLGVVLAYLVGRRLAGRGAGVVAAFALVLAGGWVRGLEHGFSEPLVVTALLGALLAYLEGSRRLAFWLVAAASLARPEIWPLLVPLAVWLGRVDRPARARAWLAVAAVPVLWVGVDWLGSGRFMNGGKTAAGVARHLSGLDELARGVATPVLPVLVLAAVAAVFALVRRERVPGLLAAAVLLWGAGLALGVEVGYPPSDRLMFPLMAAVCVLAGVGAARLVALAGSPAWRAGVAALLVAVSVPFGVARVGAVAGQVRAADARARLQLDLRHAARLARADAPGATAVALPFDVIWARGAVAWEWRLPLRDVGELHHPPPGSRVFAFVPRSRRSTTAGQPLLDTRRWSVLVDLRGTRAAARPGPG